MRYYLLAVLPLFLLTACGRWSESAEDWDSIKGKELQVAEIKCTGGGHCHLKVIETPPGTYSPERYLWITNASQPNIVFEIFTPKKDGTRERTICDALQPIAGKPGSYSGECMLPDEAGVSHNHKLTTSLRLRANGKKSVYFSFEDIGVNIRHNGEGHTTDQ